MNSSLLLEKNMSANLSQFTIDVFNYKPHGWILFMYYIEILFLIKALILSGLTIVLMIKLKIFHLNLRMLFCNQFIANILFIFIRCAIIVNILSPEPLYSLTVINRLQHIHHGIVEFFSINLISIVVERLQSTVKAASYESYFTLTQLMAFLCFPWLVAFGITLMFQFSVLDVSTILEGIIALDALFLLGFIILQLFNKKRQQSFDINTTLSYRFQIYENISTIKFLSYLCFIYSIYLVLSMVFLYLIFSYFNKRQMLMGVIISSCGFDILTAFHCFIIPLIFLISNKKLRSFFCFCYSQKVSPTPTEDAQNAESQRRLYFNELRKQWA